jgi:transposase
VWFFDESRFGTHSNVGHAWYPTGTRTAIDIKLGYENFYLYSAVNPKTGEEFTLILPKVNTLCMNIFLEQFSKVYKDKKIVMVMDGATWHKSNGLLVTDNIRNIILPAYSPELNPVEKFWQCIKAKTIKKQSI